jgi:hypothetical protein
MTRCHHTTTLPQQRHVTVQHKCLSANKQTDETIRVDTEVLKDPEKQRKRKRVIFGSDGSPC